MSRSLERLIGIDREIRRGYYPSVEKLCELFEVKERTIYEDIRKLKENFGLTIEYDRFHEGYTLKDPSKTLPSFDLTEGEMAGLALSSNFLSEQASFLKADIDSGIDKVKNRVSESVEHSVREIDREIQYLPVPLPAVKRKIFTEIRKAIKNKKRLRLKYFAASKNITTERKVEPYRILQNQGMWYLLAYCTLRNDLRLFAIHRILEMTLLEAEPFEIKNDLDIESWLTKTFQIERKEKEWKVRIIFSREAAPYIIERDWKNGTKVTAHDDGKCTLLLTTLSLEEVKRWVMYYGSNAIVLSPKPLVDMIQTELKSAYENYSEPVEKENGDERKGTA